MRFLNPTRWVKEMVNLTSWDCEKRCCLRWAIEIRFGRQKQIENDWYQRVLLPSLPARKKEYQQLFLCQFRWQT
jgi:hypothetical protein